MINQENHSKKTTYQKIKVRSIPEGRTEGIERGEPGTGKQEEEAAARE